VNPLRYFTILVLQEAEMQMGLNCESFWPHSPVVLGQALVGIAMIMVTWLGGVWLRHTPHTFLRSAGVVLMAFSLLLYFAITSSALKFGVTSGRSSSWPAFPCYAAPYGDLGVGMAVVLVGGAMFLTAKYWRARTTG